AFGAAVSLGVLQWREMDYVFWIGTAVTGAALSRLAQARLHDRVVPALLLTLAVSPTLLAAGGVAAAKRAWPAAAPDARAAQREACYAPRAFSGLASLAPGVVLSEPDMGPFVLAFTHHEVLSAPYHRIAPTIAAAMAALAARPAPARRDLAAMGVSYVVDCAPLDLPVGPDSLGALVRAGHAPDWLKRVSIPSATLQIYAVGRVDGTLEHDPMTRNRWKRISHALTPSDEHADRVLTIPSKRGVL
ncbi:MAG TPA: hypothetical protein VG248_04485, partial [Caulobacteraceae bacterium]|nr:hypothetical protein [Caulobacteraceae bacterium]